jgi:xylulokinase
MKIGLYFPRPEIVPNVQAGEWHFMYDSTKKTLVETQEGWRIPHDDARAIVESQMLSLRLRSRDLVESPGHGLPPQPTRVHLVGGGSQNAAIAKIAGEVLGGLEGVFKLDVGENACALGQRIRLSGQSKGSQGRHSEDLIGRGGKKKSSWRRLLTGIRKAFLRNMGWLSRVSIGWRSKFGTGETAQRWSVDFPIGVASPHHCWTPCSQCRSSAQ